MIAYLLVSVSSFLLVACGGDPQGIVDAPANTNSTMASEEKRVITEGAEEATAESIEGELILPKPREHVIPLASLLGPALGYRYEEATGDIAEYVAELVPGLEADIDQRHRLAYLQEEFVAAVSIYRIEGDTEDVDQFREALLSQLLPERGTPRIMELAGEKVVAAVDGPEPAIVWLPDVRTTVVVIGTSKPNLMHFASATIQRQVQDR
jgi:hypothetical protein